MQIQSIPTDKLIEYARNPRKNDAVVDKMVACIKEFGFRIPVLAKSDGTVIDGHLRLKAARKMGLKEVPVVNVDDLTDVQIKAFRLVANQSANWAEWDEELLKLEFKELDDLDFDLELTGFDLDEIEKYLQDDEDIEEDTFNENEILEENARVVSKTGDLWILGNHRLLCGDATKIEYIEKLMNGEKADLVFTDPPYNVDYAGKNSFLNAMDEGNRIQEDIENDHFADDEAIKQLLWEPAFKNMADVSKETCSIYVTMPQGITHMKMMEAISESWCAKHELIWVKNNHVLGRTDYFYKHEPILYGWKNKHKFYGNGRFNTSVWEIAKPTKSKLHPTMKPIELISECLLNSSQKNDMVLDVFGGSGSTLIACEQLNRRCFMMELDPKYVDTIIRRWQKQTNQKAILEFNGKTFDELFNGGNQ